MTRRPVAVASGIALICAIASLALLRGGHTGLTFALFNAEASNANSTFSAGWLDAPTALSASPSGNDVSLTWTGATHGPPTGQALYGADNGGSSSCPAASTLPLISTFGYTSGANTYDDAGGSSSGSGSGRGTGSNGGHYFCYAVASTAGTAWSTLSASTAVVELGLATNSVSLGGGNGTIANGDTITITYSQKPNLGSSPAVCAVAGGPVIVGDTSAGSDATCASGDSYSVAKLSPGPTIVTSVYFGGSSASLSAGSGSTWIYTITLGGADTSSNVTGSGSWSYTPSSGIGSANGSNTATICTSGSNCIPTPSGSF